MSHPTAELNELLGGVIAAAIVLTRADFGVVQLLDDCGRLGTVAQRGLYPDWIAYWDDAANDHEACRVVLTLKRPVIIEDVESSPLFVDSPALEIHRRVGVRAVQCTPMLEPTGRTLGILSTLCRRPHRPSRENLKVLDLLAGHATVLVKHALAVEPHNTPEKLAPPLPDQLTRREEAVMQLMLEGMSNKEIGRKLGISHRTVEIHKARVLEKAGVTTVVALTRIACNNGIVK